MSKELTTQSTALSVSDAEKLARTIAMAEHGESALEKSAGNNMLKIMIGEDLGIGPGAALKGIHMVKVAGSLKPELSGALMAGLIDNSPNYRFVVLESTNATARIEYFRREEDAWVSRGIEVFTMEMAKNAGLTSNDTYKKYPGNMIYWRAMANGFRKYCPGLGMGGVYVEGELSEGLENGIELPSEPVNVTPHKTDMDHLVDRIAMCSGILQGPENTEVQRKEKRRAHQDLLGIQRDQLEAPDSMRLSPKRTTRLEELIDLPVPDQKKTG